MGRRPALVVALLTALLAGCTTSKPVRATAWLDRLRQLGHPSGPDVIQMHVALLERPVGDPYINGGLWTTSDEQVVALERRATLEDNGFRVGQIGGIPPAEFFALLTSERSCVNPRGIQLHSGKATSVVLGPPLAACRFIVQQDGRPAPVSLDQAQCSLEVLPTLVADGRTRLQFTPIVQHGATRLQPAPAADHSGWTLQAHRPTDRYDDLIWEVTLPPNEYVVVGGRFDRPETLGHQCFVRPDEPSPVQYVLVIRTGRASADLTDDPPGPVAEDDSPLRPPPLACQAALSTVRGVAP
jgi:hypothetical protein